ncbi:MAG: class I tRNA ligase family protein, partial [Pseudoxanthomonas sp.]|nr:class I tRNA ligase family protein [Pseudoxanthomonas sp.]
GRVMAPYQVQSRYNFLRGTFIMARTYLDVGLEPDALRYYFACKSSGGVDDLDLNLSDFIARVNSDLVGKFVNIASRCAKLLETHFGNVLWTAPALAADADALGDIWRKRVELLGSVAAHTHGLAAALYADDNFAAVTRNAMTAADQVNEYIAQTAPWALAKDPARREELHVVLSTAIQAFADIAGVLKPIVPAIVAKAEAWLGVELEVDGRVDLDGRTLPASYPPLFTRIDPKLIDAMTDASKDTLAAAPPAAPAKAETKKAEAKPAAATAAPATDAPQYIGIEDFSRLDLRIGKVLECGFVDGSDKLLHFLLDAGELGQRQIFSGIRGSYGEPEKLVGRAHFVQLWKKGPDGWRVARIL